MKKRGRKECPACGAHRIMWGIADNTCPVCGCSLEHVPVTRSIPAMRGMHEADAQCEFALARRISVWNHW
ncbi:MAG TPA: hypothetical protein VF790_01865 [Dissulfurispiraceae bacterium]